MQTKKKYTLDEALKDWAIKTINGLVNQETELAKIEKQIKKDESAHKM